MGKRSRRERTDPGPPGAGRTNAFGQGRRLLQMAAVVIAIGVAAGLLVRTSRGSSDASLDFTQVGRNGPVFTVSVKKAKVDDEEYLMRIAERLSAQDAQSGASGQVSVMVWPDDVAVPKEPPTTEFDASMKTQAAGIFINPKLNIKHVIRFRNGETISERDFGKRVQ